MENTKNLKLPLLVPNQSGKEITHNEALVILDNLLHNGAIDKDLTTPPDAPNANDLYIVGVGGAGAWEGKDRQLAYYDNGWRFSQPKKGTIYWINDEACLYVFTGTVWSKYSSGEGGGTGTGGASAFSDLEDVYLTSLASGDVIKFNGSSFVNSKELQSLLKVGINCEANSDNKLAVKSDNVLFDNVGTSSRVKVNKKSEADVASHLFQNNYSGRAEFGLVGDDDFSLKVSSDGESWNSSFVVDKSTGNIDFKGTVTQNGNSLGGGGGSSDFVKVASFPLNNISEVIFDNILPSNNYIIYFTNIRATVQNFTIISQLSINGGTTFVNGANYTSVVRTNHASNVLNEGYGSETCFYLTSKTDGWSMGGGSDSLFCNGTFKIFDVNSSAPHGRIGVADFDYTSSGTMQIESSHSACYLNLSNNYNAIKLSLNKGLFKSGTISIYKMPL